MKIEELFIGAWVLDNGKPAHVTYLSCFGDIGTTCSEHTFIGMVEPVPLTNEILYGHGFDYHHKNYASLEYPSGNTFMLAHIDEGVWCINDLWRIRYVHELQLALRVHGVNKEINLYWNYGKENKQTAAELAE